MIEDVLELTGQIDSVNTLEGEANASNELNGQIDPVNNLDGEINFSLNLVKNYGGGGVAELLTEITYEELKNLRESSQLVSGMFYRITDYVTTTVQENTQSVGHQFDIIVRALDENTLDEEAKAIQNENDEYFVNSNLTGWQVWYTLNNDTARFAWADEVNGKGVIYRLIDENGNDCPYDFKNIQMLDANNSEDTTYYYTFDHNGTDYSLNGTKCFDNIIKKYVNGVQTINHIILKDSPTEEVYGNFFDFNCYNNTFHNYVTRQRFGVECYNNVFEGINHMNSFDTKFRENYVGGETQSITVGQGAKNNTFAKNIYYCTFGNYFRNNVLCKYLYYSSFDHYVQNIILGESEDNPAQYMRYLTFEKDVTYVNLYKTDATSKQYMENVKVCSGTKGTSTNRINIEVEELAQKYAITYANNSDGELQKYCDADKPVYTADDITFEDGSTFQEKYDSGELKGETGPQGEQGIQGETGPAGVDGKTPVKGTDYYTEADKQEMVNLVLEALPSSEEVSY